MNSENLGKLQCVFILIVIVLSGCGGTKSNETKSAIPPTSNGSEVEDSLAQMRSAMAQGDWSDASSHSEDALIANPSDPNVLTDVAKVTAMAGDKRSAAIMLAEAAKLADFKPESRVNLAIATLVDVGELYKAIEFIQSALEEKPNDLKLRRTLVGFLGEAERYDLIPEHMKKLILGRGFDIPLLIVTTETSFRRFDRSSAKKLVSRNPDDRRVELSTAKQMMDDRDFESAVVLLNAILERHSDFAPASAMLGQAMIETSAAPEKMADWMQSVPNGTEQYCDYWLTVGDLVAEDQSQRAAAVRAYWEATKRDPNNTTSWSRLVRSLQLLDDSSDAPTVAEKQFKAIRNRTSLLLELRRRYYHFSGGPKDSQTDAYQIAETLFELGRYWESEAWSAIASSLSQEPFNGLSDFRQRVVRRLQKESAWIAKAHHPELQLDLSALPLPKLDGLSDAATLDRASLLIPEQARADHVRFVDQSREWGLQSIGKDNNPKGVRLTVVRTTGVGAGVVDYDLDGRPDLAVMGAGGSIRELDSQSTTFLRNVGQRFETVTKLAGVADKSFGQGICVGDYNEDGFPDVLFTNFGFNRLYRNNGDGTFQERTQDLGSNELNHWSTSGAFCDVNNDGLSDLFVTNYCKVPDSLSTDDESMGTHPLDYPSQEDLFYVAKGNGMFKDESGTLNQQAAYGRGLGVLVGQLAEGRFGIYVANDMRANNFYEFPSLPTTNSEHEIKWPVDSAVSRGIAVDGQTQTQASMGIANSDLDGDGDLDIYVTGFAREYNILYEQVADGLWEDRTSQSRLIGPTHSVVAFGADAIDMDNDGIDELIITNGNIGSIHEHLGIGYEQPLQVFRRGGDGVFKLVEDDSWGSYFDTDHVGRSLVNADFNGDGLIDVAITHNYEPVALLMNGTQSNNHHIGIQLIGTVSSRDAVGAKISFQCGDRQRTLWCVAGDGFMCSNERILRAGLREESHVDNVLVTWRDGSKEEFGSLRCDRLHLLVQGQGSGFEIDQSD